RLEHLRVLIDVLRIEDERLAHRCNAISVEGDRSDPAERRRLAGSDVAAAGNLHRKLQCRVPEIDWVPKRKAFDRTRSNVARKLRGQTEPSDENLADGVLVFDGLRGGNDPD